MTQVKTLLKDFKYLFYVIFHPFDGFWDLKHEKRGNLKVALVVLFFVIFVFMLQSQFTGYIFSASLLAKKNIIVQFTSVLLPFMLWCVSNWCITTLMDGEGRMVDIFTTSAYALVPMIIINLPLIVLSNIFSNDEATFYSILSVVAILWSAFLLFTGIMTIHQFSVLKTIATCFIAIVGMIIMIFLCILFLTITEQFFGLITEVYKEWLLRS
jgi:hypothetical protein